MLACIGTAQAYQIDYTFVEAVFSQVEIDGVDDGDGWFIGGSYGFGTNWLAFAEYSTASFDAGPGTDVDFDQLTLGVGGHCPMTTNVDFVGKLGFVDLSAEVRTPFGNASADDTGILLSAGVRALVMPRVELSGALEYIDVGDGDDTGIKLQGLYQFTDLFALGAALGFGDNTDQYGIFGRVAF
jgi:hypothetical protein